MDASKLLLAAKDRMKLRELACMWAQELEVSWPELERQLLWACSSGQFGSDFLVCDTYFLRRDDVLGFARRHGLEPPSWWRSLERAVPSRAIVATDAGQIKRRRGPKPIVTERVKAAMRDFAADDLSGMKIVEMAAKFGASPDTCRQARAAILSEK
jgi:hypothetical protein